jgi:alpha-1,3-rhamnosyl/mannosyltransferase
VAAEVCEVFGADPARVRAVAHGVTAGRPTPDGSDGRDGHPMPDGRDGPVTADPPYILALGTVEPRKDLPLLVRTFDRVATTYPELGLVIAGADGWGAAGLVAALAAAHHRGRIRRLGYVDDADRQALLAGAAVFAYPSRYEGFGLPPLEAMAAGVPVVASRAGALPEVLGDAAVLTPPGDTDALASALMSVLDSAVFADELRHKGRLHAAGFSWEDCAEGLHALYRDALLALDVRA